MVQKMQVGRYKFFSAAVPGEAGSADPPQNDRAQRYHPTTARERCDREPPVDRHYAQSGACCTWVSQPMGTPRSFQEITKALRGARSVLA